MIHSLRRKERKVPNPDGLEKEEHSFMSSE
jgi:hypothetical protein